MWIESTIAMRFLREGRAQTTLIIVGIAVGVSVIVFITALIQGLQANIIERTLGTQAHIKVEAPDEVNRLVPLPPGTAQLVLETRRAQRLRSINNWQQVQATLDALPGVKAVSPVVSGPAFAWRGNSVESVALVGMDPVRYQRIIPLGEDIIAGTLRVGAGDAVIGSLLANDLGVRVGDKFRLVAGDGREAQLNIAGIFELGVRELDQRYVYLDLKQTQSLLDLPGGVTVIDLTVNELFGADAIAARIAQLTGLKAESWMESNAQLMNALSSQSLSTAMISFFVAVSVAFGIASVLSISVVQRTREIGILRAMGTRRGQMLKVFLVQGAVLGFGGSALGRVPGMASCGCSTPSGRSCSSSRWRRSWCRWRWVLPRSRARWPPQCPRAGPRIWIRWWRSVMSDNGEEVLRLAGLRKSYNVGLPTETEVLHGLDLTIGRHDFASLIGPSGSGKSTLLNLLGLLDSPTAGDLFLLGEATRSMDDETRTARRASAIGFVFQFHHLMPGFTALENVMMPLLVAQGRPSAATVERAQSLLAAVGLAEFADRKPGELSGGQQQRVAIARALVTRPALLLADEPTGNLDTKTAGDVFELFRRFNREFGCAVLVVTHDPRLSAVCDRTIELVDGLIVRDARQAETPNSGP